MKRIFSVLCVSALVVGSAVAQELPHLRPVHTFSIVARDPATGEIGAAVQSHWFAVGSSVIWAEPGVGAVATQSFIEPSYGPLGLALMRGGKRASEALKALLASDPFRSGRQVAMIDSTGEAAAFTGEKDIPEAGNIVGAGKNGAARTLAISETTGAVNRPEHVGQQTYSYTVGENFSVQANLMLNNQIWPAMAKAYQESTGDLAERMLAALDAAQAAGGDIRGRQSAALIIVSGKRTDHAWDRIFDVRVDDNVEPLKELRRLVALQRAYNLMNAGDADMTRGDKEAALRDYGAAEQLASKTPGVPPSRLAEMMYWHAAALVNMGRVDEALPLFRKVFAMEKNWATLTPRLPKAGLLPNDPALIQRIVEQTGK